MNKQEEVDFQDVVEDKVHTLEVNVDLQASILEELDTRRSARSGDTKASTVFRDSDECSSCYFFYLSIRLHGAL